MTTTATVAGPDCLQTVPGAGTRKLAACDGSRLVTDAKRTFRSYIDSDFRNWGANGPTHDTPEMPPPLVDKLVKNATFAQMFAGSSFFTPSQLIELGDNHSADFSQTGATFIPIEVIPKGVDVSTLKEKDRMQYRFVAGVYVYDVGLGVSVRRFSDGYVWGAEDGDHVVRPQTL